MSRRATSELCLRAAGPLTGEHRVPGDKSISHRAALLGAIAAGRTTASGYASSVDCASSLECLRALGVRADRDGSDVAIEGAGPEGLTSPGAPLDAGNSGTTIRLISGVLAGCTVEAEITGDESLRRRPMERVARPLREMGAGVRTTNGAPPVTVTGRRRLVAIDHEPEVPSAQIKSAVLFAGLAGEGRTSVRERVRTRDHSERMLAAFGAEVGNDAKGAWIVGPTRLKGAHVQVPGDFSSAVFLIGLALLVPGSDVVLRGVGLNPTRTRFLDLIADLGAPVEVGGVDLSGPEPIGDVRVRYAERLATAGGAPLALASSTVAEIIDEVPMLAVLATRIEGGVEITGAADLRKKESDRIAALADGLRRMGAEVDERPDGLRIAGPSRLRGARVASYGDHRIAMAFACAALAASGDTVVEDPDVVGVSFPEFFDHLPEGAVVAPSD